jgi:hypothetical protein
MGANTVTGETPSAFYLIDKRGGPNGVLQLRYGSTPDDPLPFILTLTPQYVAHAVGKTLPIMIQDMQRYADQNADHLKATALHAKARGFSTEVL